MAAARAPWANGRRACAARARLACPAGARRACSSCAQCSRRPTFFCHGATCAGALHACATRVRVWRGGAQTAMQSEKEKLRWSFERERRRRHDAHASALFRQHFSVTTSHGSKTCTCSKTQSLFLEARVTPHAPRPPGTDLRERDSARAERVAPPRSAVSVCSLTERHCKPLTRHYTGAGNRYARDAALLLTQPVRGAASRRVRPSPNGPWLTSPRLEGS